jgi:hypothetical protein
MPLGLVNEVEEYITDGSSNECTEVQELAIDPVQSSLEEIALARVFRVEKFEKVKHKGLVDVSFGHVSVEIGAFYESEEKFINDLQMRPCKFQDWFVFFRVESVTGGVYRRGYGTKEVSRKLCIAKSKTNPCHSGCWHVPC